jgi:hypothetical protein
VFSGAVARVNAWYNSGDGFLRGFWFLVLYCAVSSIDIIYISYPISLLALVPSRFASPALKKACTEALTLIIVIVAAVPLG